MSKVLDYVQQVEIFLRLLASPINPDHVELVLDRSLFETLKAQFSSEKCNDKFL
jgi:hypothetical protein